ncbi:methyltransferase [Sphingomonas sp.]|uniref:class I SAM-dependent methyltransferase n=1 Tax=Sphingomonas sp. TaxID=28214 RepID=UPI00286A1352|nr:methyltransferase [Sphingomonas sp.]
MKPTAFLFAALALTMVPTIAPAAPVGIDVAVAASTRTPDNVKLDESRKPGEVLSFFRLTKGMRVIDMFGANQYWAEIMAPVVGPRGHVTVWQPTQFLNDERRTKFAAFAKRQKNVSLISSPFEAPQLGTNAYDFMIMNLDYHDVYWQNPERKITRMEPDAWLKTLYAAMKPGGTVGIIDHVALPNGDTRATVEKLHRIDPEVIKADFARAGFELVGIRNFLRNPADDHTLLVFDPAIRGKTDRVVYRFRKPR